MAELLAQQEQLHSREWEEQDVNQEGLIAAPHSSPKPLLSRGSLPTQTIPAWLRHCPRACTQPPRPSLSPITEGIT